MKSMIISDKCLEDKVLTAGLYDSEWEACIYLQYIKQSRRLSQAHKWVIHKFTDVEFGSIKFLVFAEKHESDPWKEAYSIALQNSLQTNSGGGVIASGTDDKLNAFVDSLGLCCRRTEVFIDLADAIECYQQYKPDAILSRYIDDEGIEYGLVHIGLD